MEFEKLIQNISDFMVVICLLVILILVYFIFIKLIFLLIKNNNSKCNIITRRLFAVLSFIVLIYITALFISELLQWQPSRKIVKALFSFTNEEGLISSYIEFWGAVIGAIIAIGGAIFTDRIIQNEQSKESDARERETLARVIYFDLKFAVDDMRELYNDLKKENSRKLKKVGYNTCIFKQMERKYKFKERQLYFDKEWIEDVSKYSRYIRKDIVNDRTERLYRYYGYMMDINKGIKSAERIKFFMCESQRMRHGSSCNENSTVTMSMILQELAYDAGIKRNIL